MEGEMGRKVFEVKGYKIDKSERGKKMILKKGEKIVKGVEDVIEKMLKIIRKDDKDGEEKEKKEIMKKIDEEKEKLKEIKNERERDMVIDEMGKVKVDVDKIVRNKGIEKEEIKIILMEIDIEGRILSYKGNRVDIVK